jgi:hypothetical protein
VFLHAYDCSAGMFASASSSSCVPLSRRNQAHTRSRSRAWRKGTEIPSAPEG